MNTLFVKTLLWFIGTAALTIAAVILAAAWNVNLGGRGRPPHEPPRESPFSAMVTTQMVEAQHAYEAGGVDALRENLARFQRATGAEGVLTDSQGRDLVTGRDRSDLTHILDRPPRRPPGEGPMFRLPWFLRLQPPAIARRSDHGQYSYFL